MEYYREEFALDENIELKDEYFGYGEDVMCTSLELNTRSKFEIKTWDTFLPPDAKGAWYSHSIIVLSFKY